MGNLGAFWRLLLRQEYIYIYMRAIIPKPAPHLLGRLLSTASSTCTPRSNAAWAGVNQSAQMHPVGQNKSQNKLRRIRVYTRSYPLTGVLRFSEFGACKPRDWYFSAVRVEYAAPQQQMSFHGSSWSRHMAAHMTTMFDPVLSKLHMCHTGV